MNSQFQISLLRAHKSSRCCVVVDGGGGVGVNVIVDRKKMKKLLSLILIPFIVTVCDGVTVETKLGKIEGFLSQ